MNQKKVKSRSEKKDSDSITIKVTFDRSIWEIINGSGELGKSSSGKVNHICVSWLSEHGILSGVIKKRLELK